MEFHGFCFCPCLLSSILLSFLGGISYVQYTLFPTLYQLVVYMVLFAFLHLFYFGFRKSDGLPILLADAKSAPSYMGVSVGYPALPCSQGKQLSAGIHEFGHPLVSSLLLLWSFGYKCECAAGTFGN